MAFATLDRVTGLETDAGALHSVVFGRFRYGSQVLRMQVDPKCFLGLQRVDDFLHHLIDTMRFTVDGCADDAFCHVDRQFNSQFLHFAEPVALPLQQFMDFFLQSLKGLRQRHGESGRSGCMPRVFADDVAAWRRHIPQGV